MDARQRNARTATRLWTAVAEGDAAALLEILSPEVRWVVMGRHPLAGEYRGPERVMDYLARVGESADELRSELRELFANEDGVILVYHIEAARGARRLDLEVLVRLTMRDDQILRAISVPEDQATSDAFWR